MLKKSLIILLGAVFACALAGCEKQGPTQRLGEKADNAAEKVQDTVNPKGPAEKTGRQVDKALDTQ